MTIDELAPIPREFRDFLSARGLMYDPLTQIDMLASVLSSQFLIFAGPSGTGKSTAARVLADFFVPPTCSGVIDARPAWTSAEDIAGQFSAFTDSFVKGPATQTLVRLGTSIQTTVLTVEEANLSPLEAYLGPLVTAASGVAFEQMSWPLHEAGEDFAVPEEVRFRSWPRFFATVNVDSTAEAPAPKVSGRACVVLLEPSEVDVALASTSAINAIPGMPATPPGSSVLTDPRAAWGSSLISGGSTAITDALKSLLVILQDSAGQGLNVVSPRDVQRCALYMSWHFPLLEAAVASGLAPSADLATSAENAVLHYILPGLSAEQFGRAIEPLDSVASVDGLLKRRLSRLLAGGESMFGVSPDFWASLS